MAENGLLSLEAAASLMILIIAILAAGHVPGNGAESALKMQRMGDLLVVWARENSGLAEMARDAELVFGAGNFEIDASEGSAGKIIGAKISREILAYSAIGESKIRLSVKEHYPSA